MTSWSGNDSFGHKMVIESPLGLLFGRLLPAHALHDQPACACRRPSRAPLTAQRRTKEHFNMMAANNCNITALNDNDVLLGRGTGYARYVGNKRFLRLVRNRKKEYNSTKSYIVKGEIAVDVYCCLKKRNGRFLKLVKTGQRATNVVREGVWREASQKDALEKCKQALREKREDDDQSDEDEDEADFAAILESATHDEKEEGEETTESKGDESVTGLSSHAAELPQRSIASNDGGTTSETPLFPEWDIKESITPPVEESSLLSAAVLPPHMLESYASVELFWPVLPLQPMVFINQHYMAPCVYQNSSETMVPFPVTYHGSNSLPPGLTHGVCGSVNSPFATTYNHSLAGTSRYSAPQQAVSLNHNMAHEVPRPVQYGSRNEQSQNAVAAELSSPTDPAMDAASDATQVNADISESLLSAIGLGSDQPRFTEQDEQAEQAMLTDEEKATALSDMFGDMCSVTSHQKKRPKREFDGDTVAFLVKQMRAEIERIPEAKKQALLEAQEKCREDEFSDSRLERFLLCEGMNATVSNEVSVHFIIHCLVGS